MDDLDRMYARLVQNIRAGFPEYLVRPFEVSELYQSLIPYRHNRRELELETIQDYELTLVRLLSGERGYVTGDSQMQDALLRELASPNPDTSAYRAFATTEVALAPESARAPTPVPSREAIAQSATLPFTAAPEAEHRSAPSSVPPSPAPPPSPVAAPMPPIAQTSGFMSTGGNCPYCAGALPEGRRISFCPHCGQNLTVRRCPACGTELDASWKFCTTCGRSAG